MLAEHSLGVIFSVHRLIELTNKSGLVKISDWFDNYIHKVKLLPTQQPLRPVQVLSPKAFGPILPNFPALKRETIQHIRCLIV